MTDPPIAALQAELQQSNLAETALLKEARRRAASKSLIAFTELTYPTYQSTRIHQQIAAQLERVERGEG